MTGPGGRGTQQEWGAANLRGIPVFVYIPAGNAPLEQPYPCVFHYLSNVHVCADMHGVINACRNFYS